MNQKTDEELYTEMLQGAKDLSFRQLYQRHSSPLFRFVYRFTLNRQSAEEILQDIFTQLLSGKFQVNETSNLKSWLYTLAKNKSLNHLKKSSHEKLNETAIGNAVETNDLEANFLDGNLLNKLSHLEKKLPVDLMQTWNLRKQGFDYKQIADQLSIPVGTVKSRFNRLVEHLKKEFQL
jgi:RNA polymerase sigma factor (sigma-70 family)